MAKNNAKIVDPKLLIRAGIDPKTGLPIKIESARPFLKDGIYRQLAVLDEQDAINRYTWYNLPEGLDGKTIERVLYYRGQGVFFYFNDKFYFLPYALDGTIDVYGRYTSITPLPFNGAASDAPGSPWITGLSFNPIYDVMIPEDLEGMSEENLKSILNNSCVILRDYAEAMGQIITPRYELNRALIDIMSDCFPFMRTALLNSTGTAGMRVGNENEQAEVDRANGAIYKAALEGQPRVPVVGNITFQDLAPGMYARSEDFLLAMQALDNYRLSLYGLENGGLFQKKSHMLEAEQRTNQGNTGLVMRDGLENRQRACDILNSIWGGDTWCEPSEVTLNIDITGDGILGTDEAGQHEAITDASEEVSDE